MGMRSRVWLGGSPSQGGSMQHPMLLKSRLGQLGQHILLCNTVHVAQAPQALVQHWLHVVQLTVWLCSPIFPKENPKKPRENPKFSKGQLALAKKPFVNSGPLTLVLYCYISR